MSGSWVAAFVALTALVLVLAVLVFGLLRRFSVALARVEQMLAGAGPDLGVPPGQALPELVVRSADGAMLRLPADQHGPFVLLLIEPGCRACEELAAEMSAHPWDMADVPLVMVLPAEDPQSPVLAAAGRQVVWQSGGAASAALGVAVSPVAFAVDAAGLVAGRGIPGGMEDLVGLAQQARGGQQVSEPVRP